MKLTKELRNKIVSMVIHGRKANEIRQEIETFMLREMQLTTLDELDEIGVIDQIIDANSYSFDADYLIQYLETTLEDRPND